MRNSSANARNVAAAVAAVIGLCGPCYGATMLFGLTLGAPLQLPQCDFQLLPKMPTCVAKARGGSSEDREIHFAMSEAPDMVRAGVAYPFERDGRMLGIFFETDGVNNQHAVLDALEKKFGKPTSVVRRDVGNLAGARFGALGARWKRSEFTVVFRTGEDRVDRGTVEIMTAEGLRIRAAEESRKPASRGL